MKVLILGAGGQLATDLVKTNPGHELVPLARAALDITDEEEVRKALFVHAPDLVINTAAFNRTADCEKHHDKAFSVNAIGPQFVARACHRGDVRFLHISTDYVFDGKKNAPYVESDAARPLSIYGLSKFGGECLALAECPAAIIVRTSSLFGTAGSSSKGGNFVETILSRAREGHPLEVVDDIVMAPTYTRDLAETIWKVVSHKDAAGIFHAANSGACSWHELAQAAVRLAGYPVQIKPVKSHDKPQAMKRAGYSVLASERLASLGIPPLRPWAEALEAYFGEKSAAPTPSPRS